MGRFARHFGPIYAAISDDIFKFCRALNFAPTWQQAEVLELVQRGYKRIAVRSGQGPGKTTISVIVGLWRTFRHKDALTIVTAPTMRQAKRWISECRRILEKADASIKNFIEVTKSAVRFAGRDNWGIDLVTATKPENAQGIHEDNLTVIVEEASGVSGDIIEQFEGTLTNENSLLMLIGNPNTRSCAFFDCFHRFRRKWATLRLSTIDSSRILVNRNGRDEPMVSPENILYLAEKYGEDSDVFRVRVLGDFPLQDPNTIISMELLEAATETDLNYCLRLPRAPGEPPAKQFGLDFARFGSDESVIFRRSGNAIINDEYYSKREPDTIVARAFRLQSDAHWKDEDCIYVPDAGGMGQGIMHIFRNARKKVLEFHNNGRSTKQDYDNRITEAWFHFADLVKQGKAHIPNNPRLLGQLATRQYNLTKKGKLIVESKDEYKKRDLTEDGSPDRADACVLAFYDRVKVGLHVVKKAG